MMEQPRDYLDLLPRRPLYVSRRLQRASGATMAAAFKLRRFWVFANKNRAVGLPHFTNEREQGWVYWWYRANLEWNAESPDQKSRSHGATNPPHRAIRAPLAAPATAPWPARVLR